MSNYNSLKTTIDANIKQNGRQEITGQILNSVLNQMVNILGTGYQFAGVATIDTNPGTPDAKVFYIANGKGTYTNFGGLEVTEDEVIILYWDSSWHKVSTGIASQEKLTELEQQLIYDVTANSDGATFASLSALLSDENLSTLIPSAVRCGGMSIRFVQSSDNKYVQYRLMATTWSTVVTDWKGVEAEICESSKPLDFEISDENNNSIVIFSNGNIQTKNFNSTNIPLKQNTPSIENTKKISDFEISDENNNSIVAFRNGHIITKNFNSKNIVSYDKLYNKKVCFIGDSITEGAGTDANHVYHKVFADLTGCININLGLSGSTIGEKKTNLQRFYERATATNLNGASLIVVFGGTNDFNDGKYEIGDLFEMNGNNIIPPTDTTKFGGALHQLINTIQTNAPSVPILFIQPINRGRFGNQYKSNQINAHNLKLQDYRNAIKTICTFYSIPVFNADEIPQLDFTNTNFASIYSADNLHPNNMGNLVIGQKLFEFVKNNLYF